MTTKFKFDFNENAEPVAELHRLRAALSKRYKTVDALMDYYDSVVKESGIIIKDGKVVNRFDLPPTPDHKPKRIPPARKTITTAKTKMAKAR